jgi:hypothetical protein
MPSIMTIAIISERSPRGGEIVVAASTILSMTYLTVKPVSNQTAVRDEFIANPASVNADYADFWLAFDAKGEKLARQIIQKSGRSVEQGKYDFPGMVHLFEHEVPDPPKDGDIKPWVDSFVQQLTPWKEKIRKMHLDRS